VLNTILVVNVQKKRILTYGMLGFTVLIVYFVILVHALAYTEKREVLLTTSFTIGRQKQKFKAFYVSAPAEGFEVTFNVSKGSIKFSPYPPELFEDSFDYFEHSINEMTVEIFLPWFFEGNNGTAGCSTECANQVWYLLFCNEDLYEKEIHMQITKVWREQNYQSWV